MKKRILTVTLIALVVMNLFGCALSSNISAATPKDEEAETEEIMPELSEIRSICDLATLECYYHNVAKSTKEGGSGISHLLEKDRTFWIEYTGSAKIGIDVSQVRILVDGTDVTITIPDAKLISSEVKEISSDDYIISEDGVINKNPITASDQTEAVNQAQLAMEADIENNSALLISAQDRAKDLIKNYINQIGDLTGVSYSIHWKYED